MCVGEPMRLRAVDGIAGHSDCGALVDLSLLPQARPGDWVLCFLGTAREVLAADEAARIAAAVGALRSIMAGGGMGDAFADLEARPPTLPPHLAAALAAGRTTG